MRRRILEFWGIFSRNRTATLGLLVLSVVFLTAIAAPLLAYADPFEFVARPYLWPFTDWRYPLGTDSLGRDIASGVIYGTQVSLIIGLAATAIGAGIGAIVGAVGGYYGGWVDEALTRVTEVFQTVPPFILAIVIISVVGPAIATIVVALGLVSWPPIARMVRAEVLSIREREFVQACVTMGMRDSTIIFRHVLPNTFPSIIVMASAMTALAILAEAGLSFLGLGDPNVMSWGAMVGSGRESLRTAWYIAAVPGVAILITVMALNLMGEGLNDALNPRRREGR